MTDTRRIGRPRLRNPRHDTAASAAGGSPLERSEIPDRYKWRLERIFPDWSAWEACYAEVEAALPSLARRQGTLAASGAELLDVVTAIHEARRKLEQALVYASMKSDEDTRVGENTARRGKVASLAVRFAEAVAWFESEVLAVAPDRFAALVAEEPGLALYEHFFADIQRARDHTLDAEQEALLAGAGLMARGAGQVFNAFDNADLVLPKIEGEDGELVALTKARYQKFLKSRNRRVRRDAFGGFLDTYGAMRNTLAANMDANVKNHVFFAQARRHPGTLEAALHPDAVPPSVFHALVETFNAHAPVIHRYTALKQRVLGLDPLHEYDLAVPLFSDG